MTIALVPLNRVLTESSTVENVSPQGIYRISGLLNHGRGLFSRGELSGADTSYTKLRRLRTGQLVYSKLKAFEGSIAIVCDEHDGTYVSHEFPSFDIDTSAIDSGYLGEVIRSDMFEYAMARGSTGMGARRERLHPNAFLRISVPLPDIDTQRRIASRIGRLTIDLEQRTQGARRSLLALRTNEFAALRTCRRVALSHVVTPAVDSTVVDPGSEYPNLGLLNRGRGVFRKPTVRGSETKYQRLHQVQEGQLIYSKLFGWEGSVAIVPGKFDGSFVSSEFPRFNVRRDKIDLDYLAQAVKAADFATQLAASTTGMGQRRQRVNAEAFLRLEIPLPDLETQARVAKRLTSVDEVEQLLDRQIVLTNALPRAARNEIFAELTR